MHIPPSSLTISVRAVFGIFFACCWLIAGAATASAQMTIAVSSPTNDPQQGDMPVVVYVASPSTVTSVVAAVGTRTAALTLAPHLGPNRWSGTLTIDGLPRGGHALVITATNAAAQTEQATFSFTHDKRPVLTVSSPANDTPGQPDMRVTASCTDDGPTCSILVAAAGTAPFPLAAGDGSIDAVVRPPDGLQSLEIIATDSAGSTTKITRRVLVTSNNKLTSKASYGGKILDLAADRALVNDDLATPVTLRIVDRATNASQTIWTVNPAEGEVTFGLLTPGGAIFIVKNLVNHNYYVREWRGGTLVDLGQTLAVMLNVKGQWAAYNAFDPAQSKIALILRNLTTGTNTVVDDNASNIYNDLTADGRVYYYDLPPLGPTQIFEFVPGPPDTKTQLTNAPMSSSYFPVTDGVNVVFVRQQGSPMSIVLRAGDGTETVLATFAAGINVSPRDHYRIAGGWVAFTRPGSNGSTQAWLRAPDGTERQLSTTEGTATITNVSDNGEVIFETVVSKPYSQPEYQSYFARPDGTIVVLGGPMGDAYRIDGAWYLTGAGQVIGLQLDAATHSILSEGATGTFFTTDVAILNPHATEAPVTIRYLRENAPEIQQTRTLAARSRTTIQVDEIPGLEGTGVSTVVDAPGSMPVVVERLMSWDASGYGGHLGSSVERARVRWLFAEGAQGFFHTFFLLANSGASKASVTFTFLVELGTPVTYIVDVDPGTRKTVYAGDVAALINRSFATVIESDVPVVAERAMYFGDSPLWLGGHGSTGVPEPAYKWFHAEGATGSLFDTFILLANPHGVDVSVNVIYVTSLGQVVTRPRMLPASSRLTINVENEAPELANAAFSTLIEAPWLPVVSERAMYWDTTGTGWREAHNSFGVTESGLKWGLAEGRNGGPRGYQTFVLVSNPGRDTLELRATFIKEDGTSVVRPYTVSPNSRYNIETGDIAELADSNFSTIVESINGVTFNAESAIYWNANGVVWEGGGNTAATRLR